MTLGITRLCRQTSTSTQRSPGIVTPCCSLRAALRISAFSRRAGPTPSFEGHRSRILPIASVASCSRDQKPIVAVARPLRGVALRLPRRVCMRNKCARIALSLPSLRNRHLARRSHDLLFQRRHLSAQRLALGFQRADPRLDPIPRFEAHPREGPLEVVHQEVGTLFVMRLELARERPSSIRPGVFLRPPC